MNELRVLLIEDSVDDAELIFRQLRKAGYHLQARRVESMEALADAIATSSWDAILSDYNLPGFSVMNAIALIKTKNLDLPFIIISGAIGEEIAVQLMKAGAHDYVPKSNLGRLVPVIERELRDANFRREHRKTEEDRIRLLEELREAVRARDEFLSAASHELRTPITPLKLQLQLLQRFSERNPGVFKHRLAAVIESADRSLTRLTNLIDELLDVSRITSARLKLKPERVDLHEVLLRVVDRYCTTFESRCAIQIRSPAVVEGTWDRTRMEQVVASLIGNAIRYGSGKPIIVELESQNNWALLKVTDQGMGIAEKDQARIFDRFEKATPITNFGGLGLGLYLTQEIVKAHGGTIEVQSKLGTGSVFTVRLPKAYLQQIAA
jgi:signal transduction histidine kinase